MPGESSEQGTVRYIRCPSCGTPNPATSSNCSRCGKPLQGIETAVPSRPAAKPTPPQVTCSKCGKSLPAGSKFCGFCGAPLTAPAPPAPPAPPRLRERPSAPSQPTASKVVPPIPKPPAPPPPRVPVKAAAPTGVPPVQVRPPAPIPAPPKPAVRPAPSEAEGTQVFTGLRVPKIEASISEVKPDGSIGKTFPLTKLTFIGRGDCDLPYPDDALLSPRHASLVIREGKLFLKDAGSQNGTFIKLRQDTELTPGDTFLLGRELFRFTTQSLDESQNQASAQATQVMAGAPKLQRGPLTAKLERVQLTGEVIEEFKLEKPETTIGRSSGELVFKNDPYMSGTHARIVAQPGRFILQDLRSRNGVYRKIRNEVELRDGDDFFLGEQLFRATIKTA